LNLNILFPDFYKVLNAEFTHNSVSIYIEARYYSGVCPVCGKVAHRVHSKYTRTIHDLPISKFKVMLKVHSRKFFCDNARCERHIFSERLQELALPYARKTCRMRDVIIQLMFTLSAEIAAVIIKSVFMDISPNTVLRTIRNTKIDIHSDFTVIGIDDWAFKKRVKYGTLVCDIKTHRPIDILDDRNYDTVSAWLKNHTEVKMICRDRSQTYRKAISDSLPDVVQVADRWHILKNIYDIIKQYIETHYPRGVKLQSNVKQSEISTHASTKEKKKTKMEIEQETRLARKAEIINQVKKLHESYISKREIARRLELSFRTVSKYISLECVPESKNVYRSSIIDPYLSTIKEHFKVGMKAAQIYRIIKDLGFTGSERTLRYFVKMKLT
jgi:transposase